MRTGRGVLLDEKEIMNMTPPHSVEKEGKVSARHTTLRPPRGLRVCGNSAGPRRWVRTGCGAAVVTCRRPYGASTELNTAKWVLSAQRGGVLDSARLDDHYRQLAGVSHRGGAPSAKTGGCRCHRGGLCLEDNKTLGSPDSASSLEGRESE